LANAISIAPVGIEALACRNAERAASLDNVARLLVGHFGARPISVYEAGGGSTSYISLDGLNVASITLVDIDPRQVARNDIAHETILGVCRRSNFLPKDSISSSATMSSSICRGSPRPWTACRAW